MLPLHFLNGRGGHLHVKRCLVAWLVFRVRNKESKEEKGKGGKQGCFRNEEFTCLHIEALTKQEITFKLSY